MPIQWLKDGDLSFIGLNSRDNPAALPQGYVSQSQNFRFNRGVAASRLGLKRCTSPALVGQTVYGSGFFVDDNGQEHIIVIVTDGLYHYNPQNQELSAKVNFPTGETITTGDGCDVVQARNKVFITRGYTKRPFMWDLNVTIVALSTSSSGYAQQFPNCSQLIYYCNRLFAQGAYYSSTNPLDNNYTVCVSNYLDETQWDVLDAFTINNGGNDHCTAMATWTTNWMTIFMRNSIYQLGVGYGRQAVSAPLPTDTSLQSLVTDIGCIAKRSIISANGGIIFLSDNGIYALNPLSGIGTNDSVKLMSTSQSLSAPIHDVILRINKTYAYRSVATYWNHRYYLAVPLDDSTVNNVILVYNFTNQAWESVDTYPAGFDAFNFIIAKVNNKREIFAIDTNQGIFMMEQNPYDEFGASTGIPILPFYIPSILSPSAFQTNQINSVLTTRKYTLGNYQDKRFSSCEIDYLFQSGSAVDVYAIVSNPDTTDKLESYGSALNNDETRRNPIRKFGTGIQLQFVTKSLTPYIRAIFIHASQTVRNIISKN